MVIARPKRLQFYVNENLHTVAYVKSAERLCSGTSSNDETGLFSINNWKFKIFKNLDAAVEGLVTDVINKIKVFNLNPADFSFLVAYEEVEDNQFWNGATRTDGTVYLKDCV